MQEKERRRKRRDGRVREGGREDGGRKEGEEGICERDGGKEKKKGDTETLEEKWMEAGRHRKGRRKLNLRDNGRDMCQGDTEGKLNIMDEKYNATWNVKNNRLRRWTFIFFKHIFHFFSECQKLKTLSYFFRFSSCLWVSFLGQKKNGGWGRNHKKHGLMHRRLSIDARPDSGYKVREATGGPEA